MVLVVDDAAQQEGEAKPFFDAIESAVEGGKVRVAFDCEGVDLGRFGTIELVSLYMEPPIVDVASTFLIDVGTKGDEGLRAERIAALKRIFEADNVEQVIHDCRMDSDVLHHNLGICLTNVHDTSCFHHEIRGSEDKSLGIVLTSNHLRESPARDKSVYKYNPAFWATRPLTERMTQWASSDVDQLLIVADKQVSALSGRGLESAQQKSEKFMTSVRSMKIEKGITLRTAAGPFIGRGGSNLRSLQKRTNTVMYQSGSRWVVYYESEAGLNTVKRAMGN